MDNRTVSKPLKVVPGEGLEPIDLLITKRDAGSGASTRYDGSFYYSGDCKNGHRLAQNYPKSPHFRIRFAAIGKALGVAVATAVLAGCGTMNRYEAAWHTLNAADIGVTMIRCDQLIEQNPLLGENPSDAKLAAFGVAFSLIYHAAHNWLEENEPEGIRAFEIVTLAVKGVVVAHNVNNQRKYC